MKTVGRIVLLVVGALLIGFAIPEIVENWNLLNAAGWTDFGSYPDKLKYLSAIILKVVNIIFGCVAIIAAIIGKSSLKLIISSVVMVGCVVWYFISANNAGITWDFKTVFNAILDIALPVGYVVGTFILLIS